MRWPNRQREQGKGTAPCHASHQNWTSLDQTTACSAALGWKTREQALIDRAKRSQRLHQWESTHLERAPQTSKQQGLQMSPGQREQAHPLHRRHQQPTKGTPKPHPNDPRTQTGQGTA